MAARRYTLVDVFTSTRLQGNPLAVVHDADGLPDPLMHAFARETRLSESSFVQTADDPAADYRNRIWAVTGELPFAGHPSLGVAAAVARERGEDAVTYHQQTRRRDPARRRGDGRRRAPTAPCSRSRWRPGRSSIPPRCMAALGLDAGAAHPELPCQPVSTGLRHVLAPVRDDPGALRAMRPDRERIGAAARRARRRLPLRRRDRHGARARAGALLLPATARTRPRAPPPARCAPGWPGARASPRSRSAQGVEMGRASRIACRMEGERVRVGGDVAVMIDGTVHLDG